MNDPLHAMFQSVHIAIFKIGAVIIMIFAIRLFLDIMIEKRKAEGKSKKGSILIIVIAMSLIFLLAMGLLKSLTKPIQTNSQQEHSIKQEQEIRVRKYTPAPYTPSYRPAKKHPQKKKKKTEKNKIYKWEDENGKIHYSNLGYPSVGKFTPLPYP